MRSRTTGASTWNRMPSSHLQDPVDDLLRRLLGDRLAADRAVRLADAGVEQAQVVVDLGDRADRRPRVAAGGLLVDRDGRRQPLDEVDVRLVHLAEELSRVGGQRLDVAPLPLGEDRVERQARLARPGQAGEHDHRVAREFELERPKLVPYAGRFDGFHAVPASVSKTCLVRFDNDKYSVAASAVGRPVEVHAHADRIVIRQDGRIVAEHPRSFGRGDTVYDPWHYVPVLARKPGALRNGAPFKGLGATGRHGARAAQARRRRRWQSRQMVDILTAVLTDGLPAVETACAEAIAHGVHSADVVLNILARQRDPGPPATILTPAALTLRHAPVADCARYDNLRRTI